MEKQLKPVENNLQKTEPRHNPTLIPTAVYSAETKMQNRPHDLFMSSETLDRIFSFEDKNKLVELTEELGAVLERLRDELSRSSDMYTSVGKGFRNYGFMVGANQSINNFPQYAPSFMDIGSFNDVISDYLFVRSMSERLISLGNDMRDVMNILGNIGFNYSLGYYSNLRTIVMRTNDVAAKSVFEILSRYFKSRNPKMDGEPTEMQLEKDFHALMHGKKDGEIEIKNERPTVVAGQHEVIDETHRERIEGKATIENEEK